MGKYDAEQFSSLFIFIISQDIMLMILTETSFIKNQRYWVISFQNYKVFTNLEQVDISGKSFFISKLIAAPKLV